MLWKIGQKWPKTSETQGPPLGYFYKEFERGRKSAPNGIETGVHNFF